MVVEPIGTEKTTFTPKLMASVPEKTQDNLVGRAADYL